MRFFTSFSIAATALLASLVSAGDNPFHAPLGDAVLTAGQAYTITWTPTSATLVTLTLRKGADEKNLPTLEVIADNLPNNGAFIWVPATQLAGGDDYAIEISSDTPVTTNYSPKFKIDSNGKGFTTTVEPSTTRSVSVSKTLVASTATAGALITSGTGSDKAVATGSGDAASATGAASLPSRSLPLVLGAAAAGAFVYLN